MIDAIIGGKLIRQPELKTGASGKAYTNLMLSVAVGEAENIVVTAIAFEDVAEKLSKLGKGDAVSLAGSLKPTSWTDKTTQELKHGLSLTVNQSLSLYDIKKRRPKTENAESNSDEPRKQGRKRGQFVGRTQASPANREKIYDKPFNDDIPF